MPIPDPYPPSEFGGKTQPNGFQPPPHELEWWEKVRAGHLTGNDVDQSSPIDDGSAWQGMLPPDEQRRLREQAGAFEKGEYDPFKEV